MRRKNLWTGLASVTAFLLSFSILGLDCLSLYSGTVNDLLGIQTSRVVNEGNSTDDNIYFESEYGELNSENLQKLIADTYEQAVTEEEEGAVLLKNENNALPFAQDGMRVTLFGHAVVQPVYRAASAGSKGYEDEKNNIDLYTALTNSGIAVNDTLEQAYMITFHRQIMTGQLEKKALIFIQRIFRRPGKTIIMMPRLSCWPEKEEKEENYIWKIL